MCERLLHQAALETFVRIGTLAYLVVHNYHAELGAEKSPPPTTATSDRDLAAEFDVATDCCHGGEFTAQ